MSQKQRDKYKADFTLVDVYEWLKRDYPLKTKFYDVNRILFMNICAEFNDRLIAEHVIGNPLGTKLPYSLGERKIRKCKTALGHYAIDRNLSKQYRKKIVHFNEHTQGMVCKFVWLTTKVRLKGRKRYSWESCRSHDRLLAKVLKNPDREVDYFE